MYLETDTRPAKKIILQAKWLKVKELSNKYIIMDINFEYNHVAASERLEQLATEKLMRLSEKYHFMVRTDVLFKTENTSEKDTGMICNMEVSIPGQHIFASASHESFESSIHDTIHELDAQLRKKKDKMQDLH